jgi:hypothetical protein
MNRDTSVNSSIGGMSLDDDRDLTDEEKFDLEYGALDSEPSHMQQNVPEHNKDESQYHYTDLEGEELASEQQHLLHGVLHDSKYSSVGASHGGNILRKNGH